MDALHVAGVRVAQALQAGPPWLEPLCVAVTSLADPKSVFTVCFPAAHFLDREAGLSVLWVGLLSEWLNVVLKWWLFGERPFWWVHESGLAEKVPLRQFPVSCETGPGSPSGHCMIMGAALWPLVTLLTSLASRRSRSLALRLSPFVAYVLLLIVLGLSRVFVLAHFPHQVLGGILAGAALGWGLQGRTPTSRPAWFFLAAALALLLGTLALHRALLAAGVDVDWSIALATKWCASPAWLRRDTRPFASVCRDAGSSLGLALAAALPLHRGQPLAPRQRLAGAALALGAMQGLHRLPQPEDATLWYGASILRYAAAPWLVTSLLPRLVLCLPRGVWGAPHAE
ncbi:glucose-6-phosphatase 3 [Columba livia]|uniref:glucose-6-phosphatase 3 n=1 Tax=Columba livia TaxID=8932 RepID=UPI0028BFAF22|nr:hypothetical protein Q9966_012477 [Columba livia]